MSVAITSGLSSRLESALQYYFPKNIDLDVGISVMVKLILRLVRFKFLKLKIIVLLKLIFYRKLAEIFYVILRTSYTIQTLPIYFTYIVRVGSIHGRERRGCTITRRSKNCWGCNITLQVYIRLGVKNSTR
jgi:hypothetical protein